MSQNLSYSFPESYGKNGIQSQTSNGKSSPTKEKYANLAEYSGDDAVVSSHEMQMLLKEQKASFVNLKSKIPSLDRYCEGFKDGELITISGPTKHGKTLFCQTLTAAFTRQNEFPLWFTFEVPAREFLSRFPELPFFYMPKKLKAHAMPWLEERVQESFLKNGSRVIFIDHLHYLLDMARIRNPSIEIGTVIRKLKTMAVQNSMVIFLTCHTTKGKFDDIDELSYDSIRDSSFTAQESDCVLMIVRDPGRGENAAKVKVEFHRRTGAMEKSIELRKQNGYFVEEIKKEEE
jgi:archaellum biogenesis ATPase FlaH